MELLVVFLFSAIRREHEALRHKILQDGEQNVVDDSMREVAVSHL